MVSVGGTAVGQGLIREDRPDAWRFQAQINDVCFVDENIGWAVGDQGLVLQTRNGGETWSELKSAGQQSDERTFREKLGQLQPLETVHRMNPLRCEFHAVHFLDRNHGWIVGSYSIPYLDRTRAVMLRTVNGGKKWELIEGMLLPRINRIQFQDPRNGWAIGESGNLYRTGIYFTSDGGQSWSTQGSRRLENWRDADVSGHNFVVVNQRGELGVIREMELDRSIVRQNLLSSTTPRINSVRMTDGGRGVAVGDEGVLLVTGDGGQHWQALSTDQIPGISQFDFQSVAVQDGVAWAAGTPGTSFFSFSLETGQVLRHETPTRQSIRKIQFVSAKKGWAVGAGGAILSTNNGGKSWAIQRGSTQSVGLLAVADRPQELPLEALARYSVEDGIVSGCLCLTDQQQYRLKAATARLGCVSANSMELEQFADENAIIGEIVKQIRLIQPNVILMGGSHRKNEKGGYSIDWLRAAIRAAASVSAYPEQIENGLPVWQVDRLVYDSSAGPDSMVLDPKKLLPRTGQLIEDYVAISRAILGLPLTGPPGETQKLNYQVENFAARITIKNGNLFSGLRESGRRIPEYAQANRMGSLNAIGLAAAKQKQFAKLMAFRANSAMDLMTWRSQINGFGIGLPPLISGIWMYQLADACSQQGQVELAALTLEAMVNRDSNHVLAPSAMVWLAQYYASDEFHRITYRNPLDTQQSSESSESERGGEKKQAGFQTVPYEVGSGNTKAVVWVPVDQLTEKAQASGAVQKAGHNDEGPSQTDMYQLYGKSRLDTASRFLDRLRRMDPELSKLDQIQFLEALVVRKLNGGPFAENLYQNLIRSSQGMSSLTEGARRELNLDSEPHRRCIAVEKRPYLDGNLDDEIWKKVIEEDTAEFIKMTPPGNAATKTDMLLLAHDDEFLYIAARCHKINGQSYFQGKSLRPRDPDLRQRDRIVVGFDLDRDYCSHFEFTIDHRGWVSEQGGGNISWNPKWYVIAGQDDATWTVECAIPLKELVGSGSLPVAPVGLMAERYSYDSQKLWGFNQPSSHERGLQSGLLRCLYPDPASMKMLKFQ